jgi:putative alpha-1,2-mannosidase
MLEVRKMKQATVYDKLRTFKDGLFKEYKELKEKNLMKIMSKISIWHYPNKRTKNMTLSKDEAIVYEFCIDNNFNPSTAYKWFLVCNSTNQDLQNQLKNGTISFRKALNCSKTYKTLSQTEDELLYQIKLCVKKYVIR